MVARVRAHRDRRGVSVGAGRGTCSCRLAAITLHAVPSEHYARGRAGTGERSISVLSFQRDRGVSWTTQTTRSVGPRRDRPGIGRALGRGRELSRHRRMGRAGHHVGRRDAAPVRRAGAIATPSRSELRPGRYAWRGLQALRRIGYLARMVPELRAMHGIDFPIQRVLKQRRGQVLSMIVVMPHSCAIAATGSRSWTSNRIDVGDSRTITVVVDRISSVTPPSTTVTETPSVPSPKTVQRYHPPRRLPWS